MEKKKQDIINALWKLEEIRKDEKLKRNNFFQKTRLKISFNFLYHEPQGVKV